MRVGCGIVDKHTKYAKYGEHAELLQYEFYKDFTYDRFMHHPET
jgi:hypothetical protein